MKKQSKNQIVKSKTTQKMPKWLVYSSEIALGKNIDSVAAEYGDTRKNVRDILNHRLKANAPKIYNYIKSNGAWERTVEA